MTNVSIFIYHISNVKGGKKSMLRKSKILVISHKVFPSVSSYRNNTSIKEQRNTYLTKYPLDTLFGKVNGICWIK